ncbi:hypothetical protein [Streptacidiphilus sp. EB103A]|uniref:hypothetical protein n=1 Tax=Streptacidiphilus sp. EB103A TaxID=3156275 RepID=UPI003513E18E
MRAFYRTIGERILGSLLREETASAGCAYECWSQPSIEGNGVFEITCCNYNNCTTHCF